MPYNKKIHNRRSIRLTDHNYYKPGSYFVTLCTQNRNPYFGKHTNDGIVLSAAGKMVQKAIMDLPNMYVNVEMDEYIVMPDHVHLIAILSERVKNGMLLSLPDVVHRLKVRTTNLFIRGVKYQDWESFQVRLWQRNYYEHIIRNENEMNRIRRYIQKNPCPWK
jgi:REP element-mobilizing transposase RayT